MKVIASVAAMAAAMMVCTPAMAQKKPAPRRPAAAPAKPAAKPAPKAVPAVWYDFKGAKLGMTMDEWKAVEPPLSTSASSAYTARDEGPDRIWCSTDRFPDGKEITGTFFLSDAEKALGVVACKYAKLWTITKTYTSLRSSYVKVGEYISDDVGYKFLDGKLYEINITGSKNLLGDIMDGLTAKFGEPTSKVDDTTQNKAGATFPHMERSWLNPVASIHLETPYTKIDNLNVTFWATDAITRIRAKKRELHPAADKM